ncbi:hypothetical protein AB0B28_04205 [Glycomyces sp. NPDC046736]|uniref:hypothetical protein n=1 Tax=Glycomyces sp. NPDC046736 TaxID=3155615 RepID=UPI0033C7CD63
MVGLIARTGLAAGVLLTLAASLLLLSLPKGSPEFAITIWTAALGGFLILISITAIFIERKRR